MNEREWNKTAGAQTKSDTPRTDALLTELAVVKVTTFEHIVQMTKRQVAFTKQLERELNAALTKIKELEDK